MNTKLELQTDFSKKNASEEKPSMANNKYISEKSVELVPPDGGWCWMVVAGSFLIMMLASFPLKVFSILFSTLLKSHGESATKIAWIFNFSNLVFCFYTIFIGPLCEEFGSRKMAMFGGLASFLSVFLSAFVPSPDYLFITFSIPAGIAGATGLSLSLLVISTYFKKHRGFAIAITSIGAVAGSFLAPITGNYLLENYGYMGASLIFGAICLNLCVGGSFYQPVEWHMKPAKLKSESEYVLKESNLNKKQTSRGGGHYEGTENNLCTKTHKSRGSLTSCEDLVTQSSVDKSDPPSVSKTEKNDIDNGNSVSKKSNSKFLRVLKSTYDNFKYLKYMRVHLIAWSYCGLLLGYSNLGMWIPFVVTNAGYSLEAAAWCSSLSSIGNLIGRVLMAVLSDRKFFNVNYGMMLGLLIIGLSTIGLSLINDILSYMILTSFWGLGVGISVTLVVPAMINVMGLQLLPALFGISSLFKGFTGITFGILAGMVRDATKTYSYTLWMFGGLLFMSFIMWLLIPCAEKFDKRKNSDSNDKKKKAQIC